MPVNHDIDVDEIGDVLSVVACPECGQDLRVETRDGLGHEYVAVICPDECYALALRAASKIELDSGAEMRKPVGYCQSCQGQIVDEENCRELTLDGHGVLAHAGECYDETQDTKRRLNGLQGGDA